MFLIIHFRKICNFIFYRIKNNNMVHFHAINKDISGLAMRRFVQFFTMNTQLLAVQHLYVLTVKTTLLYLTN
jgi:hypothetical protein